MSNIRNSLIVLSEMALKSAHTPAEQIAVYDALALLGEGDEFGAAAGRIARARREADTAEREFAAKQQEFTDLGGAAE